MSTRQWRRRAPILCGLASLPLVLWLVVVLAAPTGWARRRIVAELEARSGRRVALGGVAIGLTGRIRLTGLEIGSPRATADPWLKAADIRLDLGLLQMLGGRSRPTTIDVEGAEVRVLRRADGTVELADLLGPLPPRTGRGGRTAGAEGRVVVRLRGGTVTVVDQPTQSRLRLTDVVGEGFAEGPIAVVEHLRGATNGGEIRFAGRVDRTAGDLAAEAQVRADDVALDGGMRVLRYIVPVLPAAADALKGRLSADIHLSGRGATWPALSRAISGHGGVALKRVALDGTPLIAELSRLADVKSRRGGSIRTSFVIQSGRVSTDQLNLDIGKMPITMSGWTGLDGRVDYQMQISGLDERLPDQARRLLGELKLDVGALTTLTVRGTLDRMVVQVNGIPIDSDLVGEPRSRPDDRQRLRQLGRQLRDQLLR